MSKTLSGQLKPCYDSDAELLKKIKAGDEVEVDIKRKRNISFHRKYFALLNLVFSNQGQSKSLDHLRKDLTVEAGYYELRYGLHGEEIREANSISFDSMDQDTFDTYYQRILDVICENFDMLENDIQDNLVDYF